MGCCQSAQHQIISNQLIHNSLIHNDNTLDENEKSKKSATHKFISCQSIPKLYFESKKDINQQISSRSYHTKKRPILNKLASKKQLVNSSALVNV